jgi:hypothetical protein
MFTIKSVFDQDYHLSHKELLLNYFYRAYQEKDHPGHVNMWDENWEEKSFTLPYLIYKSERFRNGNGDMHIILDEQDNIIANAGVNISDFDPLVALSGVRSWINKEYRTQLLIGKYILPVQLSWAKEKNLKTIAISFNDYNKNLIKHITRSGLGIKKRRGPHSMFYNGQYEVEFPVTINYTKQWVVYHKIDEEYIPNWELIRYVEQ